MADRYALVRAGKVENVVEWDGGNQWAPPEGVEAIRLDLRFADHKAASPGHSYDGTSFTAPPPRTPKFPDSLSFTPRELRDALAKAIALGLREIGLANATQATTFGQKFAQVVTDELTR